MLIRKMLRDLRRNKVQFISIFIMSFLGLLIFAGLDSEANGMSYYEGLYYERCDLPDLWIQGRAFDEEDLRDVRDINGIIKAERRKKVAGKAILDEERDLQMCFIESGDISRMDLVTGEPYTPGSDGVWIDCKFAERQRLGVGDTLKMKVDGMEFDAVIRGTFYHPEFVYFLPDAAAMIPDYGNFGAAFMDYSLYPDKKNFTFDQIIADAEGVDSTGGLNEQEKDICKRIGEAVQDALDSDQIVTTDKDAELSYQTFRSEIEQHESMTYLFPMVFLLIAILGIITTMTRMTAGQRTQIGTMKALGFTKKTITLHYVSYSFFLSLVGSVLGAISGYLSIADFILSMQKTTYLVPEMHMVFSPRAFGGIVVSVLVSTLVSFIACRKELAPCPAETLRPASPGKLKLTAFEKSKLWDKLDFASQWNYRDIMRNKVRSLMGVVGILGCSMLMFGALGCLDTVSFITTWMYGELNTAQYQIIMEQGTPYSVTEEYAKRYNGQMVENAGAEFEVGGVKKSGNVTVYDEGNYLYFEDPDLKTYNRNESGITMSYKMAQILGIGEGDVFRWHIVGDEEWQVSRVSDINRNPTSQGITMTKDVFEGLEYDFIPDTIYTNVNAKSDTEDDNNITGVQGMSDMMAAFDSMKGMMYAMVYILIGAAVILGVVVLYNLGVLSLVEKNREMATLKVLGFTTSKIRRILQLQNIWLTTVGIALGIPCGVALINKLFGTMPDSMDYVAKYRLSSYIYTIIGTYALSMGVTRMLSGRVKTVDMVDALKGQE